MKTRFMALSLAAGVALFSLIVLPPEAHAKRALALSQRCVLSGKQKVTVCDDAIRIDDEIWTIVASAPDWTVHFYNPESKVILSSPLSKFHGIYGFGLTINNGPWLTDLPVKPSKDTSVILGQKVNRFGFVTKGAKPKPRPAKPTGGNLSLLRADMWVLAGKFANHATILSKMYKIPNMGSVPIRLTDVDEYGRLATELDTLQAKWVETKPDTFVPPKGLRAVKSEQDVMFNKHHKNNINSMFDLGEDLPGK